MSRTEFNQIVHADIVAAPKNIVGIGWGEAAGWVVTTNHDLTAGRVAIAVADRIESVVRHLDRVLRPSAKTPPFWLLCCIYDGWRERNELATTYTWVDPPRDLDDATEWIGPPGATPRMSSTREWVACFAAHRGDPTAVLLPEAHYLSQHYRDLRLRTAVARRPWRLRRQRAAYAGRDHAADAPPVPGAALRRTLDEIVRRDGLAVDVSLGGNVTRREQLRDRYIIDIDGAVRTWDAWAWKMFSGSTVLSPASIWDTWFTQSFEPWQHFVPLSADLSDLGAQLEWCRNNDNECHAMARRARRRAIEVYRRKTVERETAALLVPKLGLGSPLG